MSLVAKMPKSEKGHYSVKYSQVICVMFPNTIPDIMILVQAVLQIFFDKIALLLKMPKLEKEHRLVKYL